MVRLDGGENVSALVSRHPGQRLLEHLQQNDAFDRLSGMRFGVARPNMVGHIANDLGIRNSRPATKQVHQRVSAETLQLLHDQACDVWRRRRLPLGRIQRLGRARRHGQPASTAVSQVVDQHVDIFGFACRKELEIRVDDCVHCSSFFRFALWPTPFTKEALLV
ncbi:hypothetical protein D3C87_1041790 [compost metagenome]